jgi:anti-anti-sigma factor
MEVDDLDRGVTRIRLLGDLDAKGASEIDLQFAALSGSRGKVVVDMSGVGFLASIGIRTLLSAAKTVARRGGRLVLLDPTEAVVKVLQTCGADTVLPAVHGTDAALAAVGAA